MNLTKPAGVFMQLMGFCVLFVGLGMLFEFPVWGVLLLALGAWMVREGRRPATMSRVSHKVATQDVSLTQATATPRMYENWVTAKQGELTYRVVSKRELSDGEAKQLLMQALRDGRIKEPQPGSTTTLTLGDES